MSATRLFSILLLFATSAFAQDYNMPGIPHLGSSSVSWAFVNMFASGGSTTTGTTLGITVNQNVEVGNIIACYAAKDESGSGTTDGTGNAQFTSITDTSGNTYTEAIEWCNMQTATTQNGACTAIYFSKVGTQLDVAETITLTHTSITSRAMRCAEFSATGNTSITEAAGEGGLANDAADPGSMTIATGVAREHLFIRSTACESNSSAYTADTDYNLMNLSTANTGTSATSMGTVAEYRIATEATSAASDPSWVSADCASAIVALDAD